MGAQQFPHGRVEMTDLIRGVLRQNQQSNQTESNELMGINSMDAGEIKGAAESLIAHLHRFAITMPLIEKLQHKAMRKRHWKMLRHDIGSQVLRCVRRRLRPKDQPKPLIPIVNCRRS